MDKNTAERPIRIGTLGASRIAPAALINPARKNQQVEVAAVAARDRARAEKYAQKHGIAQVHDSYEALIADPTLDAIYNPLPNSLHAEWTIRALQAGKHVLCEKPLASNAAEARLMAETADAESRHLMEAFHWRYHPMALRIIEIVRSGELGPIKQIGASLCIPYPLPGDIRYRLDLAGGALMDVGAYTVSMLRQVSGEEPTVLSAKAALSSPGVDRLMEADLRFPSGTAGYLQASLFSHKLFALWLRIEGALGTLDARNPTTPQMGLARLKIRTAAGTRTERFGKPATYEAQLEAFVALVREGTAVPTDGWDGVRNMQVIDDIYRAAGMQPRGLRSGGLTVGQGGFDAFFVAFCGANSGGLRRQPASRIAGGADKLPYGVPQRGGRTHRARGEYFVRGCRRPGDDQFQRPGFSCPVQQRRDESGAGAAAVGNGGGRNGRTYCAALPTRS